MVDDWLSSTHGTEGNITQFTKILTFSKRDWVCWIPYYFRQPHTSPFLTTAHYWHQNLIWIGEPSITLQQIDNHHGTVQATPHPKEAFYMDRRQRLIRAKIYSSQIWAPKLIRTLKKDQKTKTNSSFFFFFNVLYRVQTVALHFTNC